jgi:glycolate oxidase FAD binding subunit
VSDLPERLRRELGGGALEEHAAREIDGVAVAAKLCPRDGAGLAAALRLLGEAGAAALVSGAGSRLGFGNPPLRAELLLSTEALAGIDVLDADEGVAHAGAGTPLTALRDAAEAAGWELPLDAPTPDATLGGALAQAAVGPRLVGHGPPRDHLLGLEVVLASGDRTRCGGRVVKNVTGYDLMKLHTGACGTLGVIEAAWLRLRPRPEASALVAGWLPAGDAGFETGLGAARLRVARAVALVDPALALAFGARAASNGRRLLVAELGGASAEVRRERERLAQALEEIEPPADAIGRLRALQRGRLASGLRFRVAALPGRLAAAAAPLEAAGASLLAYPGAALLWAELPLPAGADDLALDAGWRAARAAAAAGGGGFVLEAAPVWAKRGRDVFGDASEALPLMRALKARFDPRGVLNPGRFAGGI